MAEVKHTPQAGAGWEITRYSDGQEILKETGPMGRFLFDITERPGLGIDAKRIRATMTTAPELLEAVRLMLGDIEILRAMAKMPVPNSAIVARDAIAKAEGR